MFKDLDGQMMVKDRTGSSPVGEEVAGLRAEVLHPTPYTLHPTPYALHPTPYTLHPTP